MANERYGRTAAALAALLESGETPEPLRGMLRAVVETYFRNMSTAGLDPTPANARRRLPKMFEEAEREGLGCDMERTAFAFTRPEREAGEGGGAPAEPVYDEDYAARGLTHEDVRPAARRLAYAVCQDEAGIGDLLLVLAAVAFSRDRIEAEHVYCEVKYALMPHMRGAAREASKFVCGRIEAARKGE